MRSHDGAVLCAIALTLHEPPILSGEEVLPGFVLEKF
jgi:hypothetical protein